MSRITLINWEKEGLITPVRTPKGRRRYKKEDIEKLLGMLEEELKPKVVLYARVSTKKQEEYLKNQIRRLEEYANFQGWQYEVISEIASGVNENRRGLLKLLNKI
ncbi:IS607 family transposase, partial [Thermoanaerobacter uzonensis]|uniref:IS607 family transposase n=1 Tax=Thermoanaerobacter uzonensis TaxID=447593 RepID=UPI001F32EF0F